MKKRIMFFLAILLLVSLSGCSLLNKSYTIYYDILSEPKNLDPQTASDQASLTVIDNIFEGLLYVDQQGNLQKGIASDINKSADSMTYTITLRDDAVWANEKRITAADFVFAFRRVLSPDTHSPAAMDFYSIKNAKAVNEGTVPKEELGVKAISDNSLQIQLEAPNENFEYMLATTYAMPCNEEFFYSTKGKYGLQATQIMSNGAFELYSWKHGSNIKLKKSSTYYDSNEVKPSVVSLNISVEGTKVERLLDKKVDAALIDGNNVNLFDKKKFSAVPIENATYGLYLNNKNKALSNINIRRSIATCFDRNTYSSVLSENLKPANAIMPHGMVLFDKGFREHASENITQKFDPQAAYNLYKTGLSELGLSKIPVLELLVNADDSANAETYFSYPSQILQKELSVFINVEKVSAQEYNKRMTQGDFDILLHKLSSPDNSVDYVFNNFLSKSNKNFISYSSSRYDELVTTATISNQRQVVVDSYKNAEKMLVDDAVFIPMFYVTDFFICDSDTKGIIYNAATGAINFKKAVLS